MGEPVWVRRVVSESRTEATPRSRTVTVPSGLHHHIARLEVAVDDRHRVHGGEDGAQLGGDRDRPRPGVRVVLGEVIGEVGALDVLHDEEQLVAVAARVVHGDKAGVVDLGGHPALAHEAAAQLVGLRWPAAIRSGRSSFTATRRSRRWSYAVQTWPMPPWPRSADSS